MNLTPLLEVLTLRKAVARPFYVLAVLTRIVPTFEYPQKSGDEYEAMHGTARRETRPI
jgi:hypothetical protein